MLEILPGKAGSMKKIVLTGSDGYIGSVLAKDLIQKGFEVVGLDTFFFSSCTLGSYLPLYPFIKKDTRKIDDLNLLGVDAVIHLAALSNDPMGEISPELTEEINYKATINLAKKAKESGVSRFLFSSSCSIYGIGKDPIVDENSQTNPLTAYAKSKIASEKELLSLMDDNFCIGLLRNSTVYGYSPKFRDDLVVNNFTVNGIANKKIKVLSDGTPWRPLIDVRDLSRIFIEFLLAEKKVINGEIFNIGFNENNFQVKDLLSEIKRQLKDCDVVYTGEHGTDTRSYKVSFDKFHKVFGHVRQLWHLDKSVNNLIANLVANKFSQKELLEGKYTRIAVLKRLIAEKKLNHNLFWQ